MTTTSLSGTNPPLALGGTAKFTATITGTTKAAVTWSVTGAGTISAGGLYTAPAAMPSNNQVTVVATLTSETTVSGSYSLVLNNPVPSISSSSTDAVAGATVSVALTGKGFVPGTVVLVNNAAAPTTYTSATAVTVQVPAASSATAVTLLPQNPSPCIGAPVAYSLSVSSIGLTVTNTDGSTNNGTVGLGQSITLSSSLVHVANNPARSWQLTGAGSQAPGGSAYGYSVYTAPAAMPANTTATTTVDVSTNTAITTSYTFTIVNPVPVLNSFNGGVVIAGTTVPITLTGSSFVPSTVILVNGVAVPSTYQSGTSIVAQIAVPANTSTAISIQAQNPAPGGGSSVKILQMSPTDLQLTATNSDGTNTGTARLGVPVSFTTTLANSTSNYRGWSLQGAGAVVYSGTYNANATYTPPLVMPSNTTAAVTVDLQSVTNATTTYTMTLINPVPVVTAVSPTQLLTDSTQTVALTGSGFVAGTTVTMNGASLAYTYIDYNDASVQVPVSATASGTLNFQIQNPSPGGGASTFTDAVQPNTITLTATDSYGVNTGYTELGVPLTMTANVAGSAQPAVTWSLTGNGTLTSTGGYTLNVMPHNKSVTITATLVSNPAITASYQLTPINPVPSISAVSSPILAAGSTTTVTITGTGFEPTTVIEVNGSAVPTTYSSYTSISAQISINPSATGELSVQANTADNTGGTSNSVPIAISAPISATAAARILDQTTFGPTSALIQHVQQEGVTAWLTEQFNTPQTVMPSVPINYPSYCATAEFCTESEWWQTVLTGNDQLRQRVAFALSELFVTSSDNITGEAMNTYVNTLATDAFSNWFTIMNDVTLSPAMGIYLNMVNSHSPENGLIANENFARENMQLFNLGLDLLNQDGSLQLDGSNNPIPAYTEAQVQAFARVFTGWTFGTGTSSPPPTTWNSVNYYYPMIAVENYHDENPKTVLNGFTLPAGQTAEQDLAQGLTNVFNHPNVPPFVCRQLIEHLVKSNPSPAYISRVAAVFANNGNNVRGDMQAVLTAIFTDTEARAGDTSQQATDGHLREPILWMTDVMRALGYVNTDPNNYYEWLSTYVGPLGEYPLRSPSVFNFFPPDYVIPGTTLTAPEFSLENTASVTDRLSLADTLVSNGLKNFNVDLSATSPLGQVLTSQGPAALVQALSNLFLYGTMDSQTAAQITSEISSLTNPAQQLRIAVYLVITSTPYKILH